MARREAWFLEQEPCCVPCPLTVENTPADPEHGKGRGRNRLSFETKNIIGKLFGRFGQGPGDGCALFFSPFLSFSSLLMLAERAASRGAGRQDEKSALSDINPLFRLLFSLFLMSTTQNSNTGFSVRGPNPLIPPIHVRHSLEGRRLYSMCFLLFPFPFVDSLFFSFTHHYFKLRSHGL